MLSVRDQKQNKSSYRKSRDVSEPGWGAAELNHSAVQGTESGRQSSGSLSTAFFRIIDLPTH